MENGIIPQKTGPTNFISKSGYAEALANLSMNRNNEISESLREHITAPFSIDTPPEKVKKRPDGFDYVPASYLDHVVKSNMPLYKYHFLHRSESMGWITYVITLEDRITGNIEIGSGSARVQVKRNSESPNFRDIIDKSNNEKAALTEAIKNAQSRFGYASDVYRKRESVPTDEQRAQFKSLMERTKKISVMHAGTFDDQWNNLGTGWSEFLNHWETWLNHKEKNTN